MQTHVVSSETFAVKATLSKGWKLVIFINFVVTTLLSISLCAIFIDHNLNKASCSCKDQSGSNLDTVQKDGLQIRPQRSTGELPSTICADLNRCPAIKDIRSNLKREAMVLKLPDNITAKGYSIDQWIVESQTENISCSNGKIHIQVAGYYTIYLQMMPGMKVPVYSFAVQANMKEISSATWQCLGKPCSKNTAVLAYLNKGDTITVHSGHFNNAKWSKHGTVMFLYS